MKSIEIYKKFLLKVNKNDTNTNIKINKGEFVLMFNEQALKWLNDTINTKEDVEEINNIQELLNVDEELKRVKDTSISSIFKLPDDFFDDVTSFSLASKDTCNKVRIINWIRKPKDINILLINENENPSFEYRETLATLNNNNLIVYRNQFQIDAAFLTYYRQPIAIDLAGYTRFNGSASTDIDSDLYDKNVDQIIDRTVLQVWKNYDSTENAQNALQTVQMNEQSK